jgi:tRNA threonylcarbamoyladenosine biosynthesis protein TsaE
MTRTVENLLEGVLPDEQATLHLGTVVAGCLRQGWVISLRGDLGTGKTTFTRGLLRALGYAGRVKSPTYTLVESYEASGLDLLHFDYYRFVDPREWLDAGFNDLFDGHNVCIVEWPERIGILMPPAHLDIFLELDGTRRRVTLLCADAGIRACVEGQWP